MLFSDFISPYHEAAEGEEGAVIWIGFFLLLLLLFEVPFSAAASLMGGGREGVWAGGSAEARAFIVGNG